MKLNIYRDGVWCGEFDQEDTILLELGCEALSKDGMTWKTKTQ